MAKAKKLPSGKWRIRVEDGYKIVDGKKVRNRVSITSDSKKEADFIAAQYAMGRKKQEKLTVANAISRYIAAKAPTLSPSTVRTYRRYQKLYYTEINDILLENLTKENVQLWLNKQDSAYSRKLVENMFGLLRSVYAYFNYDKNNIRVELSKKITEKRPIPESEKVMMLVNHARPELRRAIMLGAFCSMRRGEICALDATDVDRENCTIHVDKDMIKDETNAWIIKDLPKTIGSIRTINVPSFIIAELPTEGRICPITPKQLTDRFRRATQACHLEGLHFHDLRHYYASIAHALGVPDVYIMSQGGWSTDRVLKSVYQNVSPDFETKESEKMNDFFSALTGNA